MSTTKRRGAVQLRRLEPLMPPRLRRYVSLRRTAREWRESRDFGLRKPEETIPPNGERVTFHCVWAVEAYTPLHARALYERLEGLGFGRDDRWDRGGIRAQLERARGGPRGGSWMNLEHVFPPGKTGFMFDYVEASLPEGVRVARPTLQLLTPSVTMLVVQFVLDDDAALAFDRLSYETDFESETRIREHGFSMLPPEQVKERKLRDLRSHRRRDAAAWIGEQVPGVFASGLAGWPMPTAELVTTEIAVPFAKGGDWRGYVDFVGLGYDPLHWVSNEAPNWRLTFDRDEEFAILAGRRADVTKEKYTENGQDERWPMTYEMHEKFAKDLALWGASHLLIAFHTRLRSIRDQELRKRRFQSAGRRLGTIRDEFLRDASDARDAAVELERFADDPRRFKQFACEWQGSDAIPRREKEELLDNLREIVQLNAATLIGTEQRLRDLIVVDSTVVGTRAGLRLALVALVVALASVAITAWALTRNDGGTKPAKTVTTQITTTVPVQGRRSPRVEPRQPTTP
jgi:hypothetical protein